MNSTLPDPKDIPAEVGMVGVSEKLSSLQVSAGDGEGASSSTAAASLLDSFGPSGDHNGPVVLIIVGMAGSGKTRLTQRLTAECIRRKSPAYVVNLDPACRDPPYPVNIDIRDSIDYKKVKEVYGLGPNGAIVTSLNLFATQFNQVLGILMEKKKTHQYIIIDTPGQIEVFMWSASGSIISESLAALFPTTLVYTTDLATNKNQITFISNMMYACSILYKTKLPLLIAFNKRDLVDSKYAELWLKDFEAFQTALTERDDYSSNLASSLCLSMEEFYKNIAYVVVSAVDGFGMEEFFNQVQKAVTDYETFYRPMYEKMVSEAKQSKEKAKEAQLKKLKKDLEEEEEDDICFVRSGRDAGQGLSLKLDDDEDTSSESEQEDVTTEHNEENTFADFLNQRTASTTAKQKK